MQPPRRNWHIGLQSMMGKTTWYCAIDDPARHGAVTAGIVHGDHGCADTLRASGGSVQGKVDVKCLSDPGGACTDKAGGLRRC